MNESKTLRDLSLAELSQLATPEAWHPAGEDRETPYIFAGKAETAADTLTRPAIMAGLWPIHEPDATAAAEKTTFANTHFVCALVNAYRAGELSFVRPEVVPFDREALGELQVYLHNIDIRLDHVGDYQATKGGPMHRDIKNALARIRALVSPLVEPAPAEPPIYVFNQHGRMVGFAFR